MSKKLMGIRLSDEVRFAIKAAQKLWGKSDKNNESKFELSQTEAIGALIITGIKPLLIQHGIEPKSIGESVEDVCRTFYCYADALLMGDKSCYYITTYPKKGFWEKEGYAGRAILNRAQTLTKDGVNENIAKAEKFPKLPDWLRDDTE